MTRSMSLTLADEALDARADGSLAWARTRTAFIADIHLGKAATFRRFGIPVPERASDDLARLDTLIDEARPERLVILGDLFHAKLGLTPHVMDAMHAWRARHTQLEIILIRGNHDRSAGDPAPSLGITPHNAPYDMAPFALLHEPEQAERTPDSHPKTSNPKSQISDPKSQISNPNSPHHNPSPSHERSPRPCAMALAGHVHPAVRLRDPATGGSLRLKCFHVSHSMTILPAFGSFTGAKIVEPREGDRVLAITPTGTIADLTSVLR
jgi:metallophosphoesterase superfamily enzyme